MWWLQSHSSTSDLASILSNSKETIHNHLKQLDCTLRNHFAGQYNLKDLFNNPLDKRNLKGTQQSIKVDFW